MNIRNYRKIKLKKNKKSFFNLSEIKTLKLAINYKMKNKQKVLKEIPGVIINLSFS